MRISTIKQHAVSWVWAGMLTMGIAALVAGFWFNLEFLKVIGQTVTAAGVFAATLKYFQFLDMFKHAIIDVVNSEDVVNAAAKRLWSVEALGPLADIEKKWEEITGLVNKGRFPRLSEKMNRAVKDVYLGKDHNWHYERFQTEIKIKWADKSAGIVRVTSKRSFWAIPSRPAEPVFLSHQFWPAEHIKPGEGSAFPKLVNMTVDGEKVEPVGSPEKDGSTKFTVNKSLTGKAEYKINQDFERHFVLTDDPYIYFATSRPMDGASVRVQFLDEGLSAAFESAGTTQDFEDEGDPDPGCGKDLVRTFEGVIFPNQGFFVIFKLSGAAVP